MPKLEQLPVEIIVPVLCHLDVRDIVCCLQLSKFFNETVNAFSEAIYQAVAETAGYTKLCTAGDSGIATSDEQTSVTLEKAIENQKSGLGHFRQTKSWRDFVRKRRHIDENWKKLKFTQKQIISEFPIWRFKVHTDDHMVISSFSEIEAISWTVLDDLEYETEAQANLYSSIDAPVYSHVEFSEGFLVYSTERELVIHRSELMLFERHRSIPLPNRIRCYKARYPFVVAISDQARTAYVWEIETGKLIQTIPVRMHDQPNARTSYVEFDEAHVYVAREGIIQVYSRADGSYEGGLPSLDGWTDWTAVHHTRNHIVAIGMRFGEGANLPGVIMIICRNGSDIPWGNFANVAIAAEISGHSDITQLSVENGRCVFVAAHSHEHQNDRAIQQALYMIDLPIFSSTTDFIAQCPTIEVMAEICPTSAEITRVEQDCSAIYVAYSETDLESNARVCAWARKNQKPKTSCWKNAVTGEPIGEAYDLVNNRSSLESAAAPYPSDEDWLRNSMVPGHETPDRVFIYSFGDEDTESL